MFKNFDEWNEKKKQIDRLDFAYYVHPREVWWCSIGVNIGTEINGKHNVFERPVLILKKFNKNSILAVPLTSKVRKREYTVIFRHNNNNYAALLSQLRLVSTKRLNRKMYKMDSKIFNIIKREIRCML
jgi:mRNA interferase MazF